MDEHRDDTVAGPQPADDPPGGPRESLSANAPPGGAPGSQDPNDVDDVDDRDERLADLEDRWLRCAAEMENLKKRMVRDAERIRAEARAGLAREWLPVVDNLDLALRHADADPGAVIEGVRTVRDQAVELLARLGYPRHDEDGVPFDPARHEAVGTVTDQEVAPGTVAEVVRPGYGDGDRQLRPASVVVSAKAKPG